MSDFLTTTEIVHAAKERLAQGPWDYIAGGSETETSLRRNREAIDVPEARRHAKSQEQDQQERACAEPCVELPPDQGADDGRGHKFSQHAKAEAHRLPKALVGQVSFRLALAVLAAGFALRLKVARQFGEPRPQFFGFIRPVLHLLPQTLAPPAPVRAGAAFLIAAATNCRRCPDEAR